MNIEEIKSALKLNHIKCLVCGNSITDQMFGYVEYEYNFYYKCCVENRFVISEHRYFQECVMDNYLREYISYETGETAFVNSSFKKEKIKGYCHYSKFKKMFNFK